MPHIEFIFLIVIAVFAKENFATVSYPLKDSGQRSNKEQKTSFPSVPEIVTATYPSRAEDGETFKGNKTGSISTHYLKGKGKNFFFGLNFGRANFLFTLLQDGVNSRFRFICTTVSFTNRC